MSDETPRYARSADGTRIAYEVHGDGPPLVLVDGALCSRAMGPGRSVAKALADRYAAAVYDRRGRGASEGGVADPGREFDDLRAVIDAVGGEATVLGQSSGAALAYRAAAAGVPMVALVGYEAPWVGLMTEKDGRARDYAGDVRRLLDDGKPSKAVDYFFGRMIDAPAFLPYMMKLMRPQYREMTKSAETLPNDIAVMGAEYRVPSAELSAIGVPTLVLVGEKAAPAMRAAQEQVAAAVPGARFEVLARQTHQVSAAALRDALLQFAPA
ncbi:alpha/beta fold hydrolase [Herbiconiux sp. L3-i23]|uniref:alpha/beta fold hydrolase n=1 Tax=Herbiconiux sp. L3-i23 TaxID=2905871 RepID=UPI0020738C48|nr:alpha/beta hydrolase [Herbiconiux sp. L3-i23]